MISYKEYIKGLAEFKNTIQKVQAFEKDKALNAEYYYPQVQAISDHEGVNIEYLLNLPKRKVIVVLEPGYVPVSMEMYVDGNWAYDIQES